MDIVKRFIEYTQFDTQSAYDSATTPSTDKQWAFARFLKAQLEEIGLKDVELDDNGYLFATLPSNTDKEAPVIGFIAHYDTSPDCSGANVKARIIENYDGTDIVLDEAAGIVTSVARFPELLKFKGDDLIVTDGHTLLGADDKAGIAEIVQAMVFLMAHPEIEHGTIRVGFNPDEEIGLGAHKFDVERFGAEWAYTMDGSELGELEYENFNAASGTVEITGVSVHPGYAKDKMINAACVANEFAASLPPEETPQCTDGYQGFFHLTNMEGHVMQAKLDYIIRDHDAEKFEKRKRYFKEIGKKLNEKYGEGTVKVCVKEQYRNMREKVEPVMHVIDIAIKAMAEAGVSPRVKAIRGGTDGAQLSYMGLPCPNIFAGGMNFHGPHEFVPVQCMEKAMQVIVNICRLTADFNE